MARYVQIAVHNPSAISGELSAGLARARASLPPKHFYDRLGSLLFQAICELPEYYPTRTEASILATHRQDLAEVVGRGKVLIDLGAGDCTKAASLFDVLAPRAYVPVDIAVDFMHDVVERLQAEHPTLDMLAVGTDFSERLMLPDDLPDGERLFFYPGSSLGNFNPSEALRFLQSVRAACTPHGGLLIGLDAVKDERVLEAAYDDALGVTAAFNLNLLRNVNRLLGSDFDPGEWRHLAFFNGKDSRIEMHLEARRALTVRWPGGERRFEAAERIHTENSYKYRPQQVEALLSTAGFRLKRTWSDAREWFSIFYAEAA